MCQKVGEVCQNNRKLIFVETLSKVYSLIDKTQKKDQQQFLNVALKKYFAIFRQESSGKMENEFLIYELTFRKPYFPLKLILK